MSFIKSTHYHSGKVPHAGPNSYTKNHVNAHYAHIPGIEIGEYTYGASTIFYCGETSTLKIGKFCSIANNCSFWIGGEHDTNFITTYPFAHYSFDWKHNLQEFTGRPSKGNIVIGNDVWIGFNVTILSGVTIGDGAVIGANALVTKDIPHYTIYGGNPIRLLKNRFSQEDTDRLLKIQWWNWPKEKINEAIPLMCKTDLYDFF